jgi:hypothetical protein
MTIKKLLNLGPVNPFEDASTNTDSGIAPSGGLVASPIGTATHGDEAAYRAAQIRACGEKPGGSAGFGMTGELPFSTYDGDGGPTDHDGDMASGTSGYGKGIAGEFPLVTKGYKSSDTGSDRSGYGKEIG